MKHQTTRMRRAQTGQRREKQNKTKKWNNDEARDGGVSDITATLWLWAANSVVTWSRTERVGTRRCKSKHMETVRPQNLDLVSKSEKFYLDLQRGLGMKDG